MEIRVLDLRKFAADQQTEITFKDTRTGHACKVNKQGRIEIFSKGNPMLFTIEDVIQVADEFLLEDSGQKNAQVLSRAQMAKLLEPTYAAPATTGKRARSE